MAKKWEVHIPHLPSSPNDVLHLLLFVLLLIQTVLAAFSLFQSQ